MRNHNVFLLMLGIGIGALYTGCKGPLGATGPMGPSGYGAASPVYFFDQNFDGVDYNPSSQFTLVEEEGGTESIGLTGSDFVSAPNSLSISSSTGAGPDSGVYTSPGAFPYLSGYDYYLDTYADFGGVSGTGVKAELVLVVNGSTVATVGCVASTGQIYTYNNGSTVNIAVNSGLIFQHFVLYWNHSTGLSNITINGATVSQNLVGMRSEPEGAPKTCAGVCFPASTDATDEYVLLDNVTVYHY